MRNLFLVSSVAAIASLISCRDRADSDAVQQSDQEILLREATAQVGMPAIHHFWERRLLKLILELRDQDGLATYTYLWSGPQGKMIFFCDSIGYGIPAATQYTNPQKPLHLAQGVGVTLPQADPNSLFSPSAAEGTWIVCQDPNGPDTKPVYIEERIVVAPFKLEKAEEAEKATTLTPKTRREEKSDGKSMRE